MHFWPSEYDYDADDEWSKDEKKESANGVFSMAMMQDMMLMMNSKSVSNSLLLFHFLFYNKIQLEMMLLKQSTFICSIRRLHLITWFRSRWF